MATVYLRSTDGNDADDGSTWALAKATWASALTAAGAGGTIYVSKNHAEVITTNHAGGADIANTIKTLGVDDAGDPEPPASLVTKASANHPKIRFDGTVEITGYHKIYGFEFHTDSSTSSDRLYSGVTAEAVVLLEQGWLRNTSTGTAAGVKLGGSSSSGFQRVMELIDTDITSKINSSAVAAITVDAGATIVIRGGALTEAMNHSAGVLFGCTQNADRSSRIDVADFDVSALSSTQYLFIHSNKADCHAAFKRLKTPATFNAVSASDFQHSFEAPFKMHGYGNADAFYSFFEESAEGTCEEDTAIYRDSGATYDGTNGFSVKMSSNAGVLENTFPLRFKLAEIKLDLTASKTITVHTVQDAGTILQDDDFWLEIEHMDSTDLALGSFVQTRPDDLATPANLTSSSEAWTGDAGGADHRQVAHTISAITGASTSVVTIWACLAKPSTTLYVCPKPEVT